MKINELPIKSKNFLSRISKVNETLDDCKRMSRMSIGRRKLLHVKSHTVKSYTAT